MKYKETLWNLLDELFNLENGLWVCDEQRFNVGITENMIFDKQDEIAENIENIRLKYEAMLKDKMLKEE